MSKQEIAELFEEFLNENGQWHTFKNWLQERGYDLTDVCMTDEDQFRCAGMGYFFQPMLANRFNVC